MKDCEYPYMITSFGDGIYKKRPIKIVVKEFHPEDIVRVLREVAEHPPVDPPLTMHTEVNPFRPDGRINEEMLQWLLATTRRQVARAKTPICTVISPTECYYVDMSLKVKKSSRLPCIPHFTHLPAPSMDQ